ncbi:uncharacterized protein LOC121728123 [Aricia agestis]|uniref:uncharacterized protein LOC121728123 n=1 Tax=Aricia agestis TaxID=91739 RepID=UPI001C207396|nr:uncharacterized protein LOC121728123 [Aricia agestis]
MLRRFRNHFEDPKRPYLGPNVKLLKYGGLLFSRNNLVKYSYMLMHYTVFAVFGTELLNIYLERSDTKVVLQNIQYSMASVVVCLKVFTYFKYQNDWVTIIEYINKRDKERRNTRNDEMDVIIQEYTKYSRWVTFSYIYLLVVMTISVCLQPMLLFTSSTFRYNLRNGTATLPEIASIWMPVDKTTVTGYTLYMFMEIFATIVCVLWFAMVDTNSVAIMIFIEAELRMLRIDARNIFGTEKNPATIVESKQRIRKCHENHIQLSKSEETSTFQKIVSLPYLLFGCLRLFMYCWHSTVMTHSSIDQMMGPYESTWWAQPTTVRKEVLLLVHQFRKPLAIHAGPIADLTVVTFINILKGAYSYYTLLREMK